MQEPFADSRTFWGKRRYLLLMIISLSIAFSLVIISMSLYIRSGTIQLDLSRPGYQRVSNQTDPDNISIGSYPSSGALDTDALKIFEEVLNSQIKKAKSIDAFGGDPLDPNELNFYQ